MFIGVSTEQANRKNVSKPSVKFLVSQFGWNFLMKMTALKD